MFIITCKTEQNKMVTFPISLLVLPHQSASWTFHFSFVIRLWTLSIRGGEKITVVLICKSILFGRLNICPRAESKRYCTCFFCDITWSCEMLLSCCQNKWGPSSQELLQKVKCFLLLTTAVKMTVKHHWHFLKVSWKRCQDPILVNFLPQLLSRKQQQKKSHSV